MAQKIVDKINELYSEYIENYRKGYERFGYWWKVLNVSILSIALIFILFALILFIFYLP